MVEIVFRLPPEALGQALQAAAEALRGTEGAAENVAFQPEAFRRLLSRETAEVESGASAPPAADVPAADRAAEPGTRPAAGRRGMRPPPEAAERLPPEVLGQALRVAAEGPWAAEAETAGRSPALQTAAGEDRPGAEHRAAGETPALSPPWRGRPGPALPVRRGTGTAAGPLSAPGPGAYAPALPGSGASGPWRPAAAGGEGGGLPAEALSERWERDSRRYDGGFTLY